VSPCIAYANPKFGAALLLKFVGSAIAPIPQSNLGISRNLARGASW